MCLFGKKMTEKAIKKWWEAQAKDFQKKFGAIVDVNYGPGAPNERRLKLLGNIKGKEILEIGCGGGQCTVYFAKKGAKVTGVDLSEEQLKFAKKLADKHKVDIKFIQGSFQNLSKFKSNSKDIVFSAYALQYSPDLLEVFKQVKRILKKNGLFVFSFDHPIWKMINYKTLKVEKSYFKIGRYEEKFSSGTFVGYSHTIEDTYDKLVKANLFVERIIEPDSRKRYPGDTLYNVWDYKAKTLKMVPPTIIFKCRKK